MIGKPRDPRPPADPVGAGQRLIDCGHRPLPGPLGLIAHLLARTVGGVLELAPGTPGRALGVLSRLLGRRLDLAAELPHDALQLSKDVLGLLAPASDHPGDQLLAVAPGHPPPADRVVDDLLEAVARDVHALLERLAEGLDALLGAGARLLRLLGLRRPLGGCLLGRSHFRGQSTRAPLAQIKAAAG